MSQLFGVLARRMQRPDRAMSIDDRETFAIVGAAMQVHRTMGGSLLEAVYVRALAIEFRERDVPFVREPPLELSYRGHPIGVYRADFLCFDSIIVEVKARPSFNGAGSAQTMHYLMASGATRALLLNFGDQKLEWRRFVRGPFGGAKDDREPAG